MWNLISINPICQKKKVTSDQERLLVNINNVRKRVDNNEPWRPSHSLSKWANKYTHQTEEKIMHQNNMLLNKMMAIQRQPQRNQSAFALSHVGQQAQRRFEKSKINAENHDFLKRLQSAQSMYPKKYWAVDDEKNQKYKEIILKRTKIANTDYDELARKQLESRSTTRILQSQQKSRKVFNENEQLKQTQ